MSFLDHLTPDQRNTIVSLPYRVGLWISHSDASGGDEASRQELQALSNILQGFTEETFGSEVTQHIMSETLAKKARWPDWARDAGAVLKDCAYAIDVLREHTDPKEISAFCNHLLEIGEAVAMAFREPVESGGKARAYLSYLLSKTKKRPGRLHNRSFRDYIRISVSEHKALAALAKALSTPY